MAPCGPLAQPRKMSLAGLQHTLPLHDAFALVLDMRRLVVLGDHGRPRFLDLDEQRLAHMIDVQHHEATCPHAADAHHLEHQVLCREMTEQVTPVVRHRLQVLAPHAFEHLAPIGASECFGFFRREQRVRA
jgi:hypothetical protein